MNAEKMKSLLPMEAPAEIVQWAKDNLADELGGEYLIYSCERVRLQPGAHEILADVPAKNIWMARCNCSACQEEFVTEKIPGRKAIRLFTGEDGMIYPCEPGLVAHDGNCGYISEYDDGEIVICPNCLEALELIHASKLQPARKKQIMVVSVESLGGYATIISYLIAREISEFGLSDYFGTPADAYVLDEAGKVWHFNKMKWGGAFACETARDHWELRARIEDNLDKRYFDWRSINNKKAGAALYDSFPDPDGTTAEKTGLVEFLRAGGTYPLLYLRLWCRCKGVENLVKTGQAQLIQSIIQNAYRYSADVAAEASAVLNMSETKPYAMLGFTKDQYRRIRNSGLRLHMHDYELFSRYRKAGGGLAFYDFLPFLAHGADGVLPAIRLMEEFPGDGLYRVVRFIVTQGMRLSEAGILLDARRMAAELAAADALAEEQLWPVRLLQTHDRLTAIKRQMELEKQRKDAEAREAGFQGIIERYGHLEWTDGELCVRLPVSTQDLIREGDILRHCVGGYTASHIAGKDTIFFIRHYRRPERPYYTLDIDMTGRPAEKQLHGYGNERHGAYKQYEHSIPRKVRAFCDRWKNEVLIPWWAENETNKQEAKTA